ncbi:aminotransferase class I/II-fold pyridoxal phosphate-dependent enzyme [Mesorhizobium sp. M0410]|uniref:aminotransferase class I/II-fold pyridoxal phosphate-dependent enzyme n=1 Tax=Mesorhizobium sp. M0410 TaxID=2956943 RepID=UPI00333DF452
MALWLRLRGSRSAETWASAAARSGVAVTPGNRLTLDAANAPEAFRFGFASLDEAQLRKAVTVLARTRSAAG